MSKSKVSADNKGLKKAASHCVKFPKSALRKAFETMADAANIGDASTEAKAAAALDVVAAAQKFSADNADRDEATRLTGWRDNVRAFAMELGIAGNKFAEVKPGDGDKPATARLTGYGANVMSIAKGCIEFELAEPFESYRDARKTVEGERLAKRRTDDPGAAELTDAKAACDEAWQALRKLVFDTGDVLNVNALRDILAEHAADVEAQIAEADAIEAEAEAA